MARAARTLIVANWKMYVQSPDEAKEFVRKLKRRSSLFAGVDVAIAPPFPFIPLVASALKGSKISVAAQALSSHESGAHTGEVSASMLKHAGVSSIIIGHSERRAAGESDAAVAEALRLADMAGMRMILCIGEQVRDQGGAYFDILAAQLKSACASMPKSAATKQLVIAYEPIWAIGKTAQDAMKPEDLRETVIFIRKTLADMFGRDAALKIPILYGGSVELANARDLIKKGNVSGFLVGHASAEIDSFLPILVACGK